MHLEDLRGQREEGQRQRQEREKIRLQKLEEIRQEEERLKTLLQQSDSWQTSQELRQFIRALEETARDVHGETEPGGGAAMSIEWARQQADRLDPLAKSPPSIVDEKPKRERSSIGRLRSRANGGQKRLVTRASSQHSAPARGRTPARSS